MSDVPRAGNPRFLASISRSELLCGLFLVAIVNAEIRQMIDVIGEKGWLVAATQGFGVSWVMWLAVGLCVASLAKAARETPTRADLIVAVGCCSLFAWPTPHLSMFAITALGLYAFVARPHDTYRRAAAIIMLSIAVSGLWSKLVMTVWGNPILEFDAALIGLMTGTPVTGNVVRTIRDGMSVIVATPCSFVANASLALLLWIAITRSLRPAPIRQEIVAGIVIFAGVIVINTIRMALMVQDRAWFELMHGGLGSHFVSPTIMLFTLVVTAYGLKHELAR